MELVSNCCGANPYINIETGMCSDCKEHCEFINIDYDS